MHIQKNNIKPATSQKYIYSILSLANSTLLIVDIILWLTKKPIPN